MNIPTNDIPVKSLSDLPRLAIVDILRQVCETALLVNGDDHIVDARCTLPGFTDDMVLPWLGGPLRAIFEDDSAGKLSELLYAARHAEHGHWRQLNHRTPEMARGLAVDYISMPIDSQNTVLLLGRDLSQLSRMQQQLMHSQLAAQRAYEDHRTDMLRYSDLLEFMPTPLLVLSADHTQIKQGNSAAACLLLGVQADRAMLQGITFPAGLKEISSSPWVDHLPLLLEAAEHAPNGDASVTLADIPDGVFTVSARPAGDDCLVMLDQTAPEGGDHSGSGLGLDAIIRHARDAYIVLDETGIIRDANRGFYLLLGLSNQSNVIGTAFDQWLDPRALTGQQLVKQADHSNQSGSIPLLLRDRTGWLREVEASLIGLNSTAEKAVGVVIRDVAPFAQQQASTSDISSGVDQLAHLVGHKSLKEIVGDATDIIEQMCIKAALDLTADNRAAAADLLGISRQSLYVKMRKTMSDIAPTVQPTSQCDGG